MNKKDKEFVSGIVDNEGFDYAFTRYSDFSEIKDKKFHELRKAYCDAQEALAKYFELPED